MLSDMTVGYEKRLVEGVEFVWIAGERGAFDGPSKEFRPLYEAVRPYLRSRGLVVQAGGCMGLYPRLWREIGRFDRVVTCEPDPDNFSVLEMNCPGPEYLRYNFALGERVDQKTLWRYDDTNRGMHSLTRENQGRPLEVYVSAIDDLRLDACDLIQLDVEGYELPVLLGADATIRRFTPVVTVEAPQSSVSELMRYHGYAEIGRVVSDVVFAPKT